MEEKNQVNEVDHSLYDFRYEEKESDFYKVQEGRHQKSLKRFQGKE